MLHRTKLKLLAPAVLMGMRLTKAEINPHSRIAGVHSRYSRFFVAGQLDGLPRDIENVSSCRDLAITTIVLLRVFRI